MLHLYQLTWVDAHLGRQLRWLPSYRAAQRLRAELRQEYKTKEILADELEPSAPTMRIQKILFPTKKAQLLSWLNAHLTSDNG